MSLTGHHAGRVSGGFKISGGWFARESGGRAIQQTVINKGDESRCGVGYVRVAS